MHFLKLLRIPLFLIKKKKKDIQGNNLHIFLWHLQDQKSLFQKITYHLIRDA